jgi:hypothetical protein
MRTWWDTHITQEYKWSWTSVRSHSGIDLAEVNGTPLTAAVAGVVVAAGARDWGGQVSIRFDLAPGQPAVLTYIHMSDIAPGIDEGVHVVAGQYIGKTGGAKWSSPIPTKCCSTGPHLHLELSYGDLPPYWHSYEPYKPDRAHYPLDPTNFFYALRDRGITGDQSAIGANAGPAYTPGSLTGDQGSSSSSGPKSAGTGAGDRAHKALQDAPGFGGIVAALDAAETFSPYVPPSAVVAPTVGDASISLGPWEGTMHIPGLSDAAHAAAAGNALSNAASYTFGWLASNGIALLVRALLVIVGLLLVGALLYAQARKSTILQAAQPDVDPQQVAQVAEMAAMA